MDLSAIEDDLIAKLVADITTDTPEIRSFPDNPADYQLLHPKGAILVRYNGSNSETPVPNPQLKAVQLRTSNWTFFVVQKSLKKKKGHQGVYGLLEEIRASLVGYTITGLADASIIWHTGDQFHSEVAGTWRYTVNFSFTFPESEA